MTDAPESRVNTKLLGPNPWAALLVVGVLTLGLGVWLLLSYRAGAATIAILLAIGLFLNGLSELVWAPDRGRPALGYAIGAAFIVGGLIVVFRPDSGLRALAVLIGVVLIAVGVFQGAGAFLDRENLPHWGWQIAVAVITIGVGVVSIVWPEVTIRVLSLIFGIRLIIVGGGSIALGWQLRSLR